MMYYKERFKDFFAIDELLCLQLIGYSDADICHSFYSPQEKEALQKTIANSPKQHEKAKQILKKQTEAGVATISFYSDEYPWFAFNNLIPDAPPLLHILGDRKLLLRTDCVTIIGSRCADQAGREAAYSLARKFTLEGHVIVSGLAAGCDTTAHRGCWCRREDHRLCRFWIRHHASEDKPPFTRRNHPMRWGNRFRTSVWRESQSTSINCPLPVSIRYVLGCDCRPMPDRQRNHVHRFLHPRI